MHGTAFDRHRELFSKALPTPWPHQGNAPEFAAWISEALETHALFPADEAQSKRLPQLMVFVSQCAPPGASTSGLRLACEFLFAFFLFNDDWAQHGANFYDQAPARPLSTGARYVRAWLQAFCERFGARSARFVGAFQQYWQSLCFEQQLRERAQPPTLEEYVDRQRGRYQWVATAPYIELWEVTEGIRLEEHERAQADQLEALGVQLTYLANDIGSLHRDSPGLNYVTLRAQRELGPSALPELLEATRGDYDARVQAFLELAHGTSGELKRYASLVSAIADGNLKATLLLARSGDAGRYAVEVRACLGNLRRLEDG